MTFSSVFRGVISTWVAVRMFLKRGNSVCHESVEMSGERWSGWQGTGIARRVEATSTPAVNNPSRPRKEPVRPPPPTHASLSFLMSAAFTPPSCKEAVGGRVGVWGLGLGG